MRQPNKNEDQQRKRKKTLNDNRLKTTTPENDPLNKLLTTTLSTLASHHTPPSASAQECSTLVPHHSYADPFAKTLRVKLLPPQVQLPFLFVGRNVTPQHDYTRRHACHAGRERIRRTISGNFHLFVRVE